MATTRRRSLQVGYRIPIASVRAVTARLSFVQSRPWLGKAEQALFDARGYGSLIKVELSIHWSDGWRRLAAVLATGSPSQQGNEQYWSNAASHLIWTICSAHPAAPRYGGRWVLDRVRAQLVGHERFDGAVSISA